MSPVGGTRIALAGKGGVGKTTLTALLTTVLCRRGWSVLAVDADEQRNLGAALGLGADEERAVLPVAACADYVEEKTGSRPGEGGGGLLRLNPDASDVAERLSVATPAGARLLVMGGVGQAGGGCLCPEHAVLAAVVRGMPVGGDDVVLMDTHAGVEHFGRALARGFDQLLVVTDPTANAVRVALESARLAEQLGIASRHLVVNRVRRLDDLARVARQLDAGGRGQFSSMTALPHEEALLVTDGPLAPLAATDGLGPALSGLAELLLDSAGRTARTG